MKSPAERPSRRFKPALAVDFDDVIVAHAHHMIAAYNEEFGGDVRVENVYLDETLGSARHGWRHSPDVAWEWIHGYLGGPEAIARGPIPGAVEALTRLAKRYSVHVLTGRDASIEHVVPEWLEAHMPGIVESIHHTGMVAPKSKVCQQIGARIIIDDSPVFIHDCHAAGIEVIVFGDYAWNQPDRMPENAPRAHSWPEVEELLRG